MRSRSFSEEDTTTDGTSAAAPEYAFEGFNIEFSEKIMLSALTPKPGALDDKLDSGSVAQ